MFELRPATDEDYDFLWRVASTTMHRYVAAIWAWEDKWQEQRFRAKFDAPKWQIITVEGQDAGGMSVGWHATSVSLEYLYLLPSFQGQGIGSAAVRRLIAEAYSAGVPLTLDVLRSNPDALRLYERLGLRVVGENEERFFMSTNPEGSDGP